MAKRVSDREKKEVLAYLSEGNSQRDAAKKFHRSKQTITSIAANEEEFRAQLDRQKKENSESVMEKFEELGKVKKNILNNSLITLAERIQNKEVSTRDLITIYGVLVDKELTYLDSRKDDNKAELSKLDEILEDIKNGTNK